MKKFFLIAAMAVATIAANAQTWVGGSIGFETKHVNGFDKNQKSFDFTPEVGYTLDEKFDVAIALGYSFNNNYSNDMLGIYGATANTWSVNPYVRYKFVKAGNFTAFVDGGLMYSSLHVNGAENNANFMGINVTPGISYAISDKVSLVAHLGKGLQYGHTWVKDGYRENKFTAQFFNGVSFGAYVNL